MGAGRAANFFQKTIDNFSILWYYNNRKRGNQNVT